MKENYIPLGPEWESELMKCTKPFLIKILKEVIEERDSLYEQLNPKKKSLMDSYEEKLKESKKNKQAIREKIRGNPEWQLLQLILFQYNLYQLAKKLLNTLWLKDPFLKEMIERLLKSEERFNAQEFYRECTTDQKKVLDALDLNDMLDSEPARKKFEKILMALEKKHLLERRKSINFQVRNREMDRIVGLKKQIQIKDRLKEMDNALKGTGT